MKQEFQPAIAALQKGLAEQEQKVVETKKMINALCAHAGIDAIYPDMGEAAQATVTSIQSDTFYGKSVITAAREYLEMRKAANLGPASPREVYEGLKKGGLVFNSKSETNCITVVRNAMSKASTIFHRVPTGDYGLTKWYDKVRGKKSKKSGSEKESADSQDEEPADD